MGKGLLGATRREGAIVSTITAAELAQRVRVGRRVRISDSKAAMFLGYWLDAGIVVESRGQYRLSAEGLRMAGGLLDPDRDEVAA